MHGSWASTLQNLQQIVERGDFVVPPYPAAALRLKRLVDSGRFGLAEIADACSSDPALAAALLRVANSGVYRSNGPPITSLGRAVNRLGTRSVATLALATGVGATALATGPLVDLKYRAWRRSLTTALISQALAAHRALDREEAFLAGLLHGFGRSVALGCLERLLAKDPVSEPRSLLEWLEAIEPHRHTLARRIADTWQLPREIGAVFAPASADAAAPSKALIALADSLALALDRGATADQVTATPGLSSADQRTVAELVPGLPSALEAFLEHPDTSKRPRASAPIGNTVTSTGAELRPVHVPLADLRNRRTPEPLELVGVTQQGIVFQSERPMQEGCVARFAIGADREKIEGWFSIAASVADRGRFRIEAQAFAATREVRELLIELWTSSSRA